MMKERYATKGEAILGQNVYADLMARAGL